MECDVKSGFGRRYARGPPQASEDPRHMHVSPLLSPSSSATIVTYTPDEEIADKHLVLDCPSV